MMRYRTNCTEEGTGRAVSNMVDAAREITRATFLKYVDKDSLKEVEKILNYAEHPSHGLTMAGDWHVQYWKSRFRGHPCVYFTQSAIEFIFY